MSLKDLCLFIEVNTCHTDIVIIGTHIRGLKEGDTSKDSLQALM